MAQPGTSHGVSRYPCTSKRDVSVTEAQSRQEPPWGRGEWRGHRAAALADIRRTLTHCHAAVRARQGTTVGNPTNSQAPVYRYSERNDASD